MSTRRSPGSDGSGRRKRPKSRSIRENNARRLAVAALVRVEEGAYANLVVPGLLDRSRLDARDRGFVTELVYGATRRRRALDWALAPHLDRSLDALDPPVRAALRAGAYQLLFLATPAHAAVAATVDAAPARARGLVNAVLRRVASAGVPAWPDPATELSYPDWIVERLTADLGADAALAALAAMDEPAAVTERADGYVQDTASQLVAAHAGARPGERVADLCAAPGGKATALATAGAFVAAVDVHHHRSRLVAGNAARLGLADRVAAVTGDATQPPLRPRAFDRVLLDAPCSGLGVLRRRPDARWRVQPSDVDELAALQRRLLDAAVPLLRPGGTLVYSVCTLTRAETVDVTAWLERAHPELRPLPPPGPPWEPLGPGARLLPQAVGSDGMFVWAGTLAAQ